MKNLRLSIGTLIESIERYRDVVLLDNREYEISDMNIHVRTPNGFSKINQIIRKDNLPGKKIIFENDQSLQCANGHILYENGIEKQAKNFVISDYVDALNEAKRITAITDVGNTSYYDIAIDYPHRYVDANDIIHHNTISCAALSATVEKYGRTLIIVPNKSLVSQTLEDYVNMGLDTGVYCGDKKELNKTHTICTWQALNVMLKNTQAGTIETTIHEFIEGVVCVIVDECHQLRANALKALLTGPFGNIPIRWGLTGTIPKEQYEFMSLFCSIGQVIGRLSAKELQDEGHLSNCHINIIQLVDHSEFTDYQKELKFLTENSDRLDEIVKIIDKIKTSGNTLVLVDRVASGKEIAARLGEDAVFVSGSTKSKNRKEEYDSISNSDGKVIVATYGVASTGINIPRLFNIILIEPGKSFVRCIQSIGRGLRKAHDKNHVEIYDISSTCRFSKRHLTKRIQYYKDAQYPYSKEKLEWR
jgi:superfamily II DNA or RNA helicase